MHPDDVDEIRERIDFGTSRTKAADFEALGRECAEGEYGRATFFTMAADHRLMRGELDQARAALDAAGEGHHDELLLHPLAIRLSVELAAGDEMEQQRILAELLVRWRHDELTASSCHFVGEQLHLAGELRKAHRWFTLPLADLDPEHDELEADEELCVTSRAIVRRELGLPVDRYDALAADLGG
ncbi:hypothetical protein BH11ACT8_BH11ACT8_30480 [soil metagenome]